MLWICALLQLAIAVPVMEGEDFQGISLQEAPRATGDVEEVKSEDILSDPVPMTCPAKGFELQKKEKIQKIDEKEDKSTFIYVDATSDELASSDEADPEVISIS